jgi:hypothetical protein
VPLVGVSYPPLRWEGHWEVRESGFILANIYQGGKCLNNKLFGKIILTPDLKFQFKSSLWARRRPDCGVGRCPRTTYCRTSTSTGAMKWAACTRSTITCEWLQNYKEYFKYATGCMPVSSQLHTSLILVSQVKSFA